VNAKPIVRVRDVMTREVDVVDGLMTIDDALQQMARKGVSWLVIDKRHDDDEYGLLLVSDIARKVLALDRPPHRVNVYEIMAKPVIAVHPAMDIRYCARLFDRFELTRAPVIEHGTVVGMVSFDDLVLRGLVRAGE
jgi:signal-transduction protein with cAMP-binding, CBS, and nucleotidyltransferase domain